MILKKKYTIKLIFDISSDKSSKGQEEKVNISNNSKYSKDKYESAKDIKAKGKIILKTTKKRIIKTNLI